MSNTLYVVICIMLSIGTVAASIIAVFLLRLTAKEKKRVYKRSIMIVESEQFVQYYPSGTAKPARRPTKGNPPVAVPITNWVDVFETTNKYDRANCYV